MSLPISKAEYIYRDLRHKIIIGELAPGEKLVIREYCAHYGVSNAPVIESVRRLEQEGLVISRPNVGSHVIEWTSRDVVRSYMTRQSVDSLAARLFVDYATDAQRDELRNLNDRYRNAVMNDGPTQWRETDTALHMHIINCVMPLPVCKMMETVYAICLVFRNTFPGILRPAPEVDTHDELVEILNGTDALAAEKAAFYHVKDLAVLAEKGIVKFEDIPPSVVQSGEGYEIPGFSTR